MKHYKYGGSTAKRTANCQAWIQLSEGIPRVESEAATAGTNVHWMLEMKNLDPNFNFAQCAGYHCPETNTELAFDQIRLAKDMWKVSEEVCEKYKCEEWEAETTGELNELIGSTVDKVFSGRMQFGERMVGLIDYKSGRGVQVEAEGNEQLLHNAACLVADSPAKDMFEGVEVLVGIIIQPNRNGEIEAREWVFSVKDAVTWMSQHLLDISKAEAGNQEPNPGSHCTFCPAAATCPAKTGAARAAMLREPANVALLAENMGMVEDLKKWCSEVEKAVYNTLELGQEVPGWKLVSKRATERWSDEEAAIKRLRTRIGGKKNLVEEKLITPAEARRRLAERGVEKSVADQLVSNLTERKSSGQTIAPESDKRQGVLSAAALKSALAQVI
jgi:hypothetical protein